MRNVPRWAKKHCPEARQAADGLSVLVRRVLLTRVHRTRGLGHIFFLVGPAYHVDAKATPFPALGCRPDATHLLLGAFLSTLVHVEKCLARQGGV
jgi:hypothetical protein